MKIFIPLFKACNAAVANPAVCKLFEIVLEDAQRLWRDRLDKRPVIDLPGGVGRGAYTVMREDPRRIGRRHVTCSCANRNRTAGRFRRTHRRQSRILVALNIGFVFYNQSVYELPPSAAPVAPVLGRL